MHFFKLIFLWLLIWIPRLLWGISRLVPFADRFLISAKRPLLDSPIGIPYVMILSIRTKGNPSHRFAFLRFDRLVDNFSCGRRLLWSRPATSNPTLTPSPSHLSLGAPLIEWSSEGSDVIMHAWSTLWLPPSRRLFRTQAPLEFGELQPKMMHRYSPIPSPSPSPFPSPHSMHTINLFWQLRVES